MHANAVLQLACLPAPACLPREAKGNRTTSDGCRLVLVARCWILGSLLAPPKTVKAKSSAVATAVAHFMRPWPFLPLAGSAEPGCEGARRRPRQARDHPFLTAGPRKQPASGQTSAVHVLFFLCGGPGPKTSSPLGLSRSRLNELR